MERDLPVTMVAKIKADKSANGWQWSIRMPDGVCIVESKYFAEGRDAIADAVAWAKRHLRGVK